MSKQKAADWEAVLRQAIENSPLNRQQIAVQAGIDHGILSRFVTGQRTLTLPTAQRIGQIVGVEIRQIKKGGRSK